MQIDNFFIGIGGTGMSRLALFMQKTGMRIAGSDRAYTPDTQHPQILRLIQSGIPVFAQDGGGIGTHVKRIVISAAVEADNPELRIAESMGIPVITRSAALAEIFNSLTGWGITGTSGKTTTTGMAAAAARWCAVPHHLYAGDDLCGDSGEKITQDTRPLSTMICEIDESDGSPTLYHSDRLIITNISEDHKTIEELRTIFLTAAQQTHNEIILNADCVESCRLAGQLPNNKKATFGIGANADFRALNIERRPTGSAFTCNGTPYTLCVPGTHNIYNALAVIALFVSAGLPEPDIARGLAGFRGMKRRLELVAERGGIRIYDDYSHNPDKIAAALSTLKAHGGRVHWIFRPHGYGPMLLFRNELCRIARKVLDADDTVYMLDIFDAGGTAKRTIHTTDLAKDFRASGLTVEYVSDPDRLPEQVAPRVRTGDTIVVMGARDPYLSRYARDIASEVTGGKIGV